MLTQMSPAAHNPLPFVWHVVSLTPHAEKNPMYYYDELGRRELAGGLTRREAMSFYRNGRTDVLVRQKLGVFEGMTLWKDHPYAQWEEMAC